jgi:hypothetical protein
MEEDPTTSSEKRYDPYAPEVVRKMAVVALLCALGAFGIATLCGVVGFHSYEDYTRATQQGEVIYAHWLDEWLLGNFGPAGVLVFDEGAAVLFLALGVVATREWWVMRGGKYDPKRDKAPAGLALAIAIVGVTGLLVFFAVVKLSMAFRAPRN